MLTPRENMFEVFRCGNAEWIPLVTHVDPYNQPSREGMDPALAEAMGTVQWCDENTVLLSRYLGIEILDYAGAPLRVRRKNVTVEVRKDGNDTTEIWHTPTGALRQVQRRCREDGTSYLLEHLVKTSADLPALAAIFEDEEWELDASAAASLRKRQALIGDDGLLMCFMAGTPMGMMYRVYSGVQALAYLYYDAPAALQDLFAAMEENYQRQLAISLQAEADAYVGMDDTSTTTISPAMFERCCLDLTDQRADMCHAAGKLYFHHSCGLIRDLLPLYRRTRMDAVHAFTPPPIGDVSIVEGRNALGDRIAICGSVSAMADESWNPEAMRQGIRDLFEGISRQDHVVLGLAAYPHRTIEQTRAVVEECRRHGAGKNCGQGA